MMVRCLHSGKGDTHQLCLLLYAALRLCHSCVLAYIHSPSFTLQGVQGTTSNGRDDQTVLGIEGPEDES